ncbi:hypothetical protein KsCSTR_18450 [Candidatus Kuenenia stuttgartiensis]|uniref:Uncharacterized protein n=1 Tax=Kuenenia stuttgartiensis TaxID=174633 RepID=A0A6G7GPD9_KUEST|nr:hypothetical protein [Candidatus Kuenenia stuttgartiensis]QII11224.1 hypothetical protein KsCSTR_18450 [Candidatus Kuenenia stuttgartiensis]
MSHYQLFAPPKSTGDAVDLIDRLNDLIQFIADLSVMPTTPDNEFSFSSNGYSGLYYFLIFLQETLENCNAVISETHTGKEIV